MLAASGWLFWVSMTVSGLDEPRASEAVVSGCRDALGVDACRLADEEAAPHRAIVTFVEGSVRVDVRDGDGAEARSLSRELVFLPQESLDQRLRAAGLLVAALSASLGERPPVIEPIEAEMRVELVSFEVKPRAVGRFWIDVGASGALVWSNDWAWGGELRTSFAPGSSSWFVTASGRLLVSGARDTESLWWSGGLGIGRELLSLSSPLSLRLQLEGVIEAVDVSWDGDERSATRGGARLGARLAWADAFGPWLGCDATLAGPVVEVRRGGESWLDTPTVQWNVLAGLHFRLLGGEP